MLGILHEYYGHAILCDGYGYNASTLYHHLNMGWRGIYDAWYNLPDIDSNPKYSSVFECIYNIFTSGTGEIISGRITDQSGNPIDQAQVLAEGQGGPYIAVSNSKGIYALVAVKPYSTYNLSVTASGYEFAPAQARTGKSTDETNSSGNKGGIDFIGMDPFLYNSTENFETGDFDKFPWRHLGYNNWEVTTAENYSGTYSAQAGWVSDDEESILRLTKDCIQGNITFYYKVSSEEDWDFLSFYIDDVKQAEFSGDQDWTRVSFPVEAGARKFDWIYSKDSSGSDGLDSAWIDDIVFPIENIYCKLDAPVLHPEPDIMQGSTNIISWNPVPEATSYYVECAGDADFTDILADSGWIAETSYTFVGLQIGNTYWYRAKCRPDETWSQTSQADFQSNAFTDTTVTSQGDVLLGGGTIATNAIGNPSCESNIGPRGVWGTYNNSSNIDVKRSFDWATDGTSSFGIIFGKGYHNAGDYGCFRQTLNFSNIDTLILDCTTTGNRELRAKVLVGGTELWSGAADRMSAPHLDVTIDVSDITGSQVLELRGEGVTREAYGGGVYFDDLRTFGRADYPVEGHVISSAIYLPEGFSWNTAGFLTTTPAETEITVDVLYADSSEPIPGYENIADGADISGITESTIHLRADLLTNNPQITPILHEWSVVIAKPSYESDWSDAESSTQVGRIISSP
jgi:hypothetical protein